MVEARKKKVKEAGVKEELYPWLNLLQELEKPWGTEGVRWDRWAEDLGYLGQQACCALSSGN